MLPKDPTEIEKSEDYFFSLVKNLDVFKEMSEGKYSAYAKDYAHRRKNPAFKEFCAMTPETLEEFINCIMPMIASSINEKRAIDTVAIPIHGEKPVNFIIRGTGIQSKMTSNFSAENIVNNNHQYRLLIEEENLDFCVQIIYDELDRPARIKNYIEKDKYALKKQAAIRRQMVIEITSEAIKAYWDWVIKIIQNY